MQRIRLSCLVGLLFSATGLHAQGVPAPEWMAPENCDPIIGPAACDGVPCAPATHDECFWIRGEVVAFLFAPTSVLQSAKSAAANSDPDTAAASSLSKLIRLDKPLGGNRSGFRVSGGLWLDDDRTAGLEAGYTRLNRGENAVTFNPDGKAVPVEFSRRIALPVFSNVLNRPVFIPISLRGAVTGDARFEYGERDYQDFQLLGRMRVYQGDASRVDALVGYRRFTFDDAFRTQSNVTAVFARFLPGTRLSSTDAATAENTLDGVTLGFDWELDYGPWRLSARPKASVMYLRTEVVRSASTTVTFTDGNTRVFPEGTYTTAADAGTFEDSAWSVVPELDLQVSRSLGRNWRVFGGTSLVYFPNIPRASNQISLGIPPARRAAGTTADAPAPKTLPSQNPLLLSTFSLGLEFRY